LNDEQVFQARVAGVKFVISTDSHRPGDFHFMPLGVAIARRGWCTRSDIINTLSWNELRKFTAKKRRQMKVEV
jgi:DNA polymerase (family 10)